jgi:hypothetical protein
MAAEGALSLDDLTELVHAVTAGDRSAVLIGRTDDEILFASRRKPSVLTCGRRPTSFIGERLPATARHRPLFRRRSETAGQ